MVVVRGVHPYVCLEFRFLSQDASTTLHVIAGGQRRKKEGVARQRSGGTWR